MSVNPHSECRVRFEIQVHGVNDVTHKMGVIIVSHRRKQLLFFLAGINK